MVQGTQRRAANALVAVSVAFAATAGAQTVDDVVRRHLSARGGLEKLHAVSSLRLRGTLELPGMAPVPFVLELKRPAKMRTEILIEGRAVIRAYDGRVAWSQSPLPGEPPRLMAAEDAAEAKAEADVDMSPLVDAEAKGYRVELAGRDRLPEGETWTLVVRRDGEPPRTIQIGVRSRLVQRTEELRTVEGRPQAFVTELGDYRNESGLMFPHRVELGPKGSAERQRLIVQSVEVNPALGEDRFSPPMPPTP